MLKTLKHARLDQSYETELRKLLPADLLIVDDFGLDAMDTTESRDAYEIFTERQRAGSMIVSSNRGPDEWLGTFADPVRAQSAIDRFTGNAYDLVIDGESYRPRQKPKLGRAPKTSPRIGSGPTISSRGGMEEHPIPPPADDSAIVAVALSGLDKESGGRTSSA